MKHIIILLTLLLNIQAFRSQNLSGIKIYINPGHGGYDSDDRNVIIAPYSSGDKNGFWESVSNLDKGLALRSMLQSAGASVSMSRTTNTTADDLPLSQIVAAANTFQSDFMLSIHTNAGNGVASYVLMIHYGSDLSDSQIYPSYNPGNATQLDRSNKSRDISTEIAKNLYANQITSWSSGYQVRGDKTFARTIMGFSDGYGVLRSLTVPGVISEGAMHDYIPETYRLMNMEYKWLEAWNFYKSFLAYFKGGTMTSGVIAGQVKDSRIKNEATYHKFAGNDQMLALNGTKLTLIETGETYTVDNMQNGVFVFKNLTPGTYNIKAEKTGYYSKTQEITVTAHNISYSNFMLNRVRNTAPEVISYTPVVASTDSTEASTSITMQFNWDMDTQLTEQAFSIFPSVNGKFTWEDTNFRMKFTPNKPLEKNTVYTVTLNKSAAHPDNMSMVNDFSFQFRTKNRNRLTLLTSYPNQESKAIFTTNPVFRLNFDSKLQTSNIYTSVKILDATENILVKNNRSVVNNSVVSPYGSNQFSIASNLAVGNNYKLIIEGEVMDEKGVQVVEPIIIPFKVEALPSISDEPIRTFDSNEFTFDADNSSGSSNVLADISSQTKLFGTNANRLQATLQNLSDKAVFKFVTPVTVRSNQVISTFIHADLSYNSLEFVFSAGADTRIIKLCDLTFVGWELKECGLTSLAKDTDYQLTAIRLNRTAPYLFSSTSSVLLDNLLLGNKFYSGFKDEKVEQLIVYPNPADTYINVKNENESTLQLELLNSSGQKIRNQAGNSMYTGDLPEGFYILRINSNNQKITRTVIINR